MDTAVRADAPAVLQDALKQRYFLPHSDRGTASQTKARFAHFPGAYHILTDMVDLQEAVVSDASSPHTTPEDTELDVQRAGIVAPSAEPILIASPTVSDSESSTPATLEPTCKSSVLPSKAILDKAAALTVNDAQGQAIPFKELYRAEPGQRRRVMIIFIRHFFCGNCQEFLRTLVVHIPPTSLPANTSIVFVGCGSHTLIPSYTELTSCPYPIYADPTKRLFDILGMQRSLSLGWNSPDYIHHTLAAGMIKSIVQGVKRIPAGDVTKAGGLSQNGGEYLFEVEGTGPSGQDREVVKGAKGNTGLKVKVTFCHRMQNTRDHTEILQLVKLLGYGESEERSHRSTSRLERRWTSGGKIGNLARSLSNKRHSWLERRDSGSWSRTRRRDRSESSNRDNIGSRRSPDRFETVREDVRSRDGQRRVEQTTQIDAVTPAGGGEVDTATQRFSFEEKS